MPESCPDEENVLRAIREAWYDGVRLGTEAFEGKEVSLSRLAISSYEDICRILNADLAPLACVGEINVGAIRETGRTHETPKELTVESAPSRRNPAHAHIPQRISKGLARRLAERLELKNLP